MRVRVSGAAGILDLSTPQSRYIREGADKFCKNFNRRSFAFEHGLAHHPLFEPACLAGVAASLMARGDREKFVALSGKLSAAGTNFASMAPAARLAEAITALGEGNSWLKITSANEADDRYAALLQGILAEIEELSETSFLDDITWSSLTVFMASPNIVTPYHIDHESNFLFQIRGEKDISLFDPNDRMVLRESEIENFYVGNLDSAQYREEIQNRGTV